MCQQVEGAVLGARHHSLRGGHRACARQAGGQDDPGIRFTQTPKCGSQDKKPLIKALASLSGIAFTRAKSRLLAQIHLLFIQHIFVGCL